MKRRGAVGPAAAVASLALALAGAGACNGIIGLHVGLPGGAGGAGGSGGSGGGPVACGPDGTCPPNPCAASTTCEASTHTCVSTGKLDGVPTPGVDEVHGDCIRHMCVDGVDVVEDDPSDVPDDKPHGPCEEWRCNAGAPEKVARPKNAPCSDGGTVCDSDGKCVDCNKDWQCSGDRSGCIVPGCVDNECINVLAPMGTVIPDQIPGDCKTIVCDGAGGETTQADPSDIRDDHNDCTDDTCSGGSPQHPWRSGSCGPGGETCSQGKCPCTPQGACAADEQCSLGTCACEYDPNPCSSHGVTCGWVSDGCDGIVYCGGGNLPNGHETDVDCGGTTCALKCQIGKSCHVGADCASGHCVDGRCCNEACTGPCMACSTAVKGHGGDGICGAVVAGIDPHDDCVDEHGSCGTNGVCDGNGACAKYPCSP